MYFYGYGSQNGYERQMYILHDDCTLYSVIKSKKTKQKKTLKQPILIDVRYQRL